MTPRNPWRRARGDILAVLIFLAVSILIGVALGKCIANAEPISAGEAFAAEHSADICIALDAHPTIPGVESLLLSLHNEQGLDPRESAVAVVTSVVDNCRIHENLLRQFVARYKASRSVNA